MEVNPPEMVVVGFEIRRSDSAPIAKTVQHEIFKIILNEGTKEQILSYVDIVKKDLKDGKYKYSEYAIPKAIKKDMKDYKTKNPWVRGAEYSEKYLKIKFTPRSKVKLLYIKSMPEGCTQTDVLSFEYDDQLPLNIKINWDRQFPPLIDNKVERVLEALGMEKTITKLSEWW